MHPHGQNGPPKVMFGLANAFGLVALVAVFSGYWWTALGTAVVSAFFLVWAILNA